MYSEDARSLVELIHQITESLNWTSQKQDNIKLVIDETVKLQELTDVNLIEV